MTHWIPPSLSHRLYILRMIIIRTEPHLLNQTDRQTASHATQPNQIVNQASRVHSFQRTQVSVAPSLILIILPIPLMTFFGKTSRTAHYAYRIVFQENLYICRHPPQGALNVSDTDGISYSMCLYLSTAMILEKQISEGEDDPFRKDDNSTRCSNILYDHATIKPTATQLKYQG